MMWYPDGDDLDPNPWPTFEVEESLNYYDGDLIFTFRDPAGGLWYAHALDWIREIGNSQETLAAIPIDEATLVDIKASRIDLRSVLRRPGGRVVWLGPGDRIRVRDLGEQTLPDSVTPNAGVTLFGNP